MPADLCYVPREGAALMTPDALRVTFAQSGMPCVIEHDEEGEIDLVLSSDKTRLMLETESGFVTGVVVEVTFVDERAKFPRVCELLETLGWVAED